MYICVWGNFAHVSTILPLDIAAVLDGVVYLVIHVINQIMNAWKLTKNVLYIIQYVTLKYNHIEYQSFTYWSILVFLFYSYLHSNKITSIKSDPFHNIAKVYWLSIFLLFFVYILWLTIHVYLYFMLFKNYWGKIFKFHDKIKEFVWF
jgi:hypothetical protein